jgi:hypothetical protein
VDHGKDFAARLNDSIVQNVLKPPQPYCPHRVVHHAVQLGLPFDVLDDLAQAGEKPVAKPRQRAFKITVDVVNIRESQRSNDDRRAHC